MSKGGFSTLGVLVSLAACREAPGEKHNPDLMPTETGTVAVAPLPIDEISIAPNPLNTLSFYVTFETATPTTGWVDFGVGALTLRARSKEETTTHSVAIYGLIPESEVMVSIAAVDASGAEYAATGLTATTGELPPSVPFGELITHDAEQSQPGFTLMNVHNNKLEWPPTVVIYDELARPVWYAITSDEPDPRGDPDTSITPDGTVLVGGSDNHIDPVEVDMMNNVVWHGPPQEEPLQHHHFAREPDGTTIMLRHHFPPEQPWVDTGKVVAVDTDHHVVWEWLAFDHLDVQPSAFGDFVHFNSIETDDDHFYVNSRNLAMLFKVKRSTGEIVWRLGDNGDFAPDPTHPDPWFNKQHNPELQDDGSWLVYDNTGLGFGQTRVLQIGLDEDTMSSTILWEFPGDFELDDPWYTDRWFSVMWGSADRLANGNILVDAGTRAFNRETRIFEVTESGEVVWAMELPATPFTQNVTGSYRASRMEMLPGLEPIP